jgi:hypothetical protein
MTIKYRVHQMTKRRGTITAYIDYYDDSEPDRIMKRSCFLAKTIEEIYIAMEEGACILCDQEKSHIDLKGKLDAFCETK